MGILDKLFKEPDWDKEIPRRIAAELSLNWMEVLSPAIGVDVVKPVEIAMLIDNVIIRTCSEYLFSGKYDNQIVIETLDTFWSTMLTGLSSPEKGAQAISEEDVAKIKEAVKSYLTQIEEVMYASLKWQDHHYTRDRFVKLLGLLRMLQLGELWPGSLNPDLMNAEVIQDLGLSPGVIETADKSKIRVEVAYKLGSGYFDVCRDDVDRQYATKWLLIAAKASHVEALVYISFMLGRELIAPARIASGMGSAEDWLERAIKLDSGSAKCTLARLNFDRFGCYDSDQELAVALWEEAAGEGNAEAMWELSGFYKSGKYVQKDLEKAISLLKQAYGLGHESAKITLEGMGV